MKLHLLIISSNISGFDKKTLLDNNKAKGKDTYVIASTPTQKLMTQNKSNVGGQAIWNQMLEFNVEQSDKVTLTAMDKDLFKDDLLAVGEMSVPTLMASNGQDIDVPVKGINFHGTLKIRPQFPEMKAGLPPQTPISPQGFNPGMQQPLSPSPPQPFNPSSPQPFNSSSPQPFNPGMQQPFSSSPQQPFNPSPQQPFSPSPQQPFSPGAAFNPTQPQPFNPSGAFNSGPGPGFSPAPPLLVSPNSSTHQTTHSAQQFIMQGMNQPNRGNTPLFYVPLSAMKSNPNFMQELTTRLNGMGIKGTPTLQIMPGASGMQAAPGIPGLNNIPGMPNMQPQIPKV